ncbi:MAG: cytochrome c [Geminicoccaceae bacterium]
MIVDGMHAFVPTIMAVIGFAGAALAAAIPDGQQAFAQNCQRCHRAGPASLGKAVTGLDDPKKQASLEAFLQRHHAPDPATRDALVDWLAGVSR